MTIPDGLDDARSATFRRRPGHLATRPGRAPWACTALLTGSVLAATGCSGAAAESGFDSADFGASDQSTAETLAGGGSRHGDAANEASAAAADGPATGARDSATRPSSARPDRADALEDFGVTDRADRREPGADDAFPRATLTTSGRRLLDTCGNPFVVRGVEQIFGEQLPEGNDWVGLLDQIAASGVNALRVLANTDTLGLDDVDALLEAAGHHDLVAYVTPYGDEATSWLARESVRAMLARHEAYIVIDAFGEPTFDDRERFLADSVEAIRQVRSWGYRVPLTVTANQFGRDLPSLLELGADIVASDPLGNTLLGWQAYWGSSGYYQELHGMSLEQAVAAVAAAPFPIQLGLDRVTDFPSDETADYAALMDAAERHGIGWLWWDWYNPYGNENNLTEDGSATRLTPTGQSVVDAHAAGVRATSRRACRPAR